MRISDWSSDVCSSDLRLNTSLGVEAAHPAPMSQFYAMLVHKDEPGFTTEPKGALFVCPARISHIEDFGGTTKRIHVASGREVPASLALRHFTWPLRSEARRVGKECFSKCRYRVSPYH